jgi:arabinofuranosyltransferase
MRRLFVVATFLLFGLIVLRHAWVCDDAYITLRTVDNFLHGMGLRWNPAERVQAYTHPLWMLLLSLFMAVTHDAFYTTVLLSVVVTLAAAVVLVRRLAPSPEAAILGLAVLTCSKAFVDYSTSGLENPLLHLTLVVFAWLWLDGEVGPRKLFRLSLVASLGMLARLDAAILFLPALVVGLRQAWGRAAVLAIVRGMLPLVAWELFSLVYYGFLFPNTAYAKLHTGIPAGELVHQGLLYFVNAVDFDPLTPLAIALGLALPFITPETREPRRLALVTGVVLYLLYIVKIGGDFMSGRFLTAPLLVAVVLLVRSPLVEPRTMTMAAAGAVIFLSSLAPQATFRIDSANEGRRADQNRDSKGISDERAFYYPTCSLLGGSRTSKRPDHVWVKEGRDLALRSPPVHTTENVGFIGYYAGPRVHLVDTNALADPLLSRLPAAKSSHWRPGHFLRGIPDGYLETLRGGANVIQDRDLARYWNDLALVTRAPVWSAARWGAIWRLNTGADDHLIHRERFLYPYVKRFALADLANKRTQGSSWNAAGNVILSRAGGSLNVALGAVSRAPRVELSLDGNDVYRVLFVLSGEELGSLEVGPAPGGGMAIHTAAAPPAALERGYDEVRVRPIRGDGNYSVGHLLLLE